MDGIAPSRGLSSLFSRYGSEAEIAGCPGSLRLTAQLRKDTYPLFSARLSSNFLQFMATLHAWCNEPFPLEGPCFSGEAHGFRKCFLKSAGHNISMILLLHTPGVPFASEMVLTNGIYLPAARAIEYLRGCCAPLWARNADENFPFSFRGSSFLCKRHGLHFGVFTAHQVMDNQQERSPEELFFSFRETCSSLLRGSTCIGYTRNDNTSERFDLRAMVIPDELLAEHKDERTYFFDTSDTWSLLDGTEYVFAFGHPSKMTEITTSDEAAEVYKTEGVNLYQLRVDGTLLPQLNHGLPCLKLNVGSVIKYCCDSDLDGFSGGPVFSIHLKYRIVEFRGLITTAGKEHIRFIPAPWVYELLDGNAS